MPPHPQQFSLSLGALLGAFAVRVGLPLIGVALLMTGLLGVVSYGVLPALEALRSRNWQPVEASVESAGLSMPVSRLHPRLDTVEIQYRYFVGETPYRGVRYDPHEGQYAPEISGEILAHLRTSPQITVWVNPDNPAEALVLRDLRLPVLILTVPAFGMALAGGLMLFTGMLSWSHDPLTWRAGASGP
jgi:hypothetical protein